MVAATLWRMPSADATEQVACFDTFQDSMQTLGKSHSIADSKKLFKPGVAGSLESLRYATWASLFATGVAGCSATTSTSLRECLAKIAFDDIAAINGTAWLSGLDDVWGSDSDRAIHSEAERVWSSSPAQLVAVRVRIIPAKQFNAACAEGRNKADLLSNATLGLVASLVNTANSLASSEVREIDVYCDRHGGRRFYAGVLQHTFPEHSLQVTSESSQQSVYRLERDLAAAGETLRVRFTVKGDSFVPVALSSMIAKFLRECAMRSLNNYFGVRCSAPGGLRPTAGYPVDADRFLKDIERIIVAEKIDRNSLIRAR